MAPEPPHHLPMIRLGRHRLHGGHRFGVLADGLAVDLYPPRLHRFRYFADEIDLKQAVFKRCLLDLDMIGQAKASLERPRGDALVDEFLVASLRAAPGDGQEILLRGDGDVLGRKACDRERNAIALLTEAYDVVGWVIILVLQDLAVVDELK
jgi:hypothetical protein